jgi:hypothetical protein
MAGHAAFVKTDGTVFAHTHPEGSAAMQAMMLANGGSERWRIAARWAAWTWRDRAPTDRSGKHSTHG